MMGIIAQQALEPEDYSRTATNERHVLSSSSRPAKVEKRQITRNRTSYSCQNCRKRKIKCDKTHPKCAACVKNGDECIYGKADSVAGEGEAQAKPNENKAAGQAANGFRERNDATKAIPNSHDQLEHLSALEGKLVQLTSMVESMRKNGSSAALNGLQTPSASQSPTDVGISTQDVDDPGSTNKLRHEAVSLDRPMSELDIGRQRLAQAGPARNVFWESLYEEVDQLRSLLRDPFEKISMHCGGDDHDEVPNSDAATQSASIDQPLSYHRHYDDHADTQEAANCLTCQKVASNKSMFLFSHDTRVPSFPTSMDVTSGIPTEPQSHALFRSFVTGAYAILPFHPLRPTLARYQDFWKWKRQYDTDPGSINESADIIFMVIMNVIWYSGVLAMSTKGIASWFPGQTRGDLAAQYHDQIVKYLAFLDFPKKLQMPFLGALLTIEHMPSAEQDALQSSSFVNLLVRLGQSIGLNRESGQSSTAPLDAEIRRRAWGSIRRLDTSLSISSGLPLSIDDNESDVLPVSPLKDAFIGVRTADSNRNTGHDDDHAMWSIDDPYEPTGSTISVYQVVQRASSCIDATLRKILRTHLSPRPITKDSMAILNTAINETEIMVKDVIASIPTKGVPELGFEPEICGQPVYDCDPILGSPPQQAEFASILGTQADDLPSPLTRYHRQKLCVFHKWARITLSLMCDQLHCVAYAPFLKNPRSRLWSAARQCALHHATSFMRKFVSLASDPLLEPFRWSWPAFYHPMHAAMILLIDVYERPFSVEASRNRSWIDRVFALGDAASGIVGGLNGPSIQRPLRDGGAETWNQLRGLRNSAWKKASLDPDVLWTEEDQMLVGVAKPLTEEQRISQTLREDLLYDGDAKRSTVSSQAAAWMKGMKSALNPDQAEARIVERAKLLEHALSIGAEQVLASMKPSIHHMVRIDGQQRMPFPLASAVAHACTRAEKSYDPSSVRPSISSAEIISIQDLAHKIQSYTTNLDKHTDRAEPREKPKLVDTNAAENNIDVYNLTTPQTNAQTTPSGDPSNQVWNGIVPSGFQVDFGDIAQPRPEFHNHVPVSASTSTMEPATYVDGTADGFDWEKWDSVFGQYGGFSELMEDIQWEEADHAT